MSRYALHIDRPISEAPPIEQLACAIWVVDRCRKPGVKMLRRVLGRSPLECALAQPGRWLVAVLGRAGACVCTVATEAELIQAHCELLDLHGGGHIEVFHFLEPELRRRLMADVQAYSLMTADVKGHA